MKVSTENDNNNFGYEKITIVVDNIPLNDCFTRTTTGILCLVQDVLVG
jgi:hypothetical protein